MEPQALSLPQFDAVYSVSVAAKLAGMHPQTLRQYDRLGLVVPQRAKGGGRRYTAVDIAALREVQRLSKEEKINLAGIKRIMVLRRQLLQAEGENRRLKAVLWKLQQTQNRVFTAAPSGDIAPTRSRPFPADLTGTELVHSGTGGSRQVVRIQK